MPCLLQSTQNINSMNFLISSAVFRPITFQPIFNMNEDTNYQQTPSHITIETCISHMVASESEIKIDEESVDGIVFSYPSSTSDQHFSSMSRMRIHFSLLHDIPLNGMHCTLPISHVQ